MRFLSVSPSGRVTPRPPPWRARIAPRRSLWPAGSPITGTGFSTSHSSGKSSGPDGVLEIVNFVGLQASGKGTFFRERFAATHVHVNKDLFRNNKNPNRRQRQLVEAALKRGLPVVVDNTNPTPEDRVPLLELGRQYGAKVVGYHFDSDVRECIGRNEKRGDKVKVPQVA